MPRHDSLFKGLLRSFFADLLNLTVPDLAARLDLAHPVLLDKEFFTPGGRRRELDLLAEVAFLLAWGLAALMRRGTLDRPALKLACMKRIAAAKLEEARRVLLVNCVETYLELQGREAAEYAALCTVRENREVMRMATTWSERLEAKGLERGLEKGLREGQQRGLRALRKVLLRLLEQRFGPLPEETRAQVEAISSLERLTRLSERALTARSLSTLRLQPSARSSS